jgi:hypothetical protein
VSHGDRNTGTQEVPGKRLSIAEAFAEIPEPRVAGRSKHDLVEMLVLAACAMVCGVDDFVGIDAMGTHSNIAQAIRDQEADYVLAVKDNQPKLAESITTFFEIGQVEGWKNTPHTYVESVEKDHGRLS